MCDKHQNEYKPTENDIKSSEKFWGELKSFEFKSCNKTCEKPSLFKRVWNAGAFVRFHEMFLLLAMGYLAKEHSAQLEANAPTIVAVILLLWIGSLFKRVR